MFFDRFGFACERGFLNAQVDGFEQAQIRREDVARFKLKDVAGTRSRAESSVNCPSRQHTHFGTDIS